MPRTRRDQVYFILGGFFLTNAILGELIGGMLFQVPELSLGGLRLSGVILSVGVIPWPVVFITTDLVNEYFGKAGVRRLTFLTVGMILYCFLVLYAAMGVQAWEKSPVSSEVFRTVFGQSMWIIAGSLAAFLVSQLVDVMVFLGFRGWTGGRMLWLRATGSTVVSQVVDTCVVGWIAFVLPGKLTFAEWVPLGIGSYAYKLAIAILITPLIYLGHFLIDRYLEQDTDASTTAAEPTFGPESAPS
ncbi:MAG TPA: queuosine precursor transporter [Phycisphaerae bacterium]|nr:queuosine precursor transporter [Phycisphaerae bacterium]HPU26601.1 queuosine precursor transporter [Phycisphaerae bacterium]HQE28485.1 queuosine precursor transporter [Phycisphaerae bacterium]